MNVKNRAFLLVSLIIILLSCFLLFEGVTHVNQEIDNAVRNQEVLIDRVTREVLKNSYDPYLKKIQLFVDRHEDVRQAFADRDRDRLFDLSFPSYESLHLENQYFHAMDFNLPDGTVFLRVQKPELYGDNILDSRPIVAAVHKNLEQRSGFDVGKHGAIFWVAQPILYNGIYQGALEFGVEVKQLENCLAAILGSDVTSVLKGNEWQKAELVKHGFKQHGDYVLMTGGNTLFDKLAEQLDFVNLDDQWVKIDGKQHILHTCTPLKNFDNTQIGRLILFQDISESVQKKKDLIVHILMLTALAFILSFVILYYSFGSLIGKLEQYARENRQARDELQIAHDTLDERVKQRTVELAKSNARLEDEVTIRRRAETRLDEQRRFLVTLVESLSHPLYVIDVHTHEIIMANKAALAITGIDSHQGMTCYSMTHKGTEPCRGKEHPCPLETVRKTGKPVSVEHIHYDHDGNKGYFEVHAYPMFDRQGNVTHVVEYNLDVTDRTISELEKEKLRTQLLASQKMEAVGSLAGGVAHDFNNILTTILGYSQIMAMKLQEGDPMREMVEDIYDAAERASSLTRQLLAFSRRQVMEMRTVNLNTIVENISKMLGRLIGDNIELRLLLGESMGNVRVDVGQIEQVIMNLVVNSRDAMPEGGQLTIETFEVELDERYAATHHGVAPGLYDVLTVTDTGKGMTPEVQGKIFEPFFTTKKRDKGTGLGLAMVYGIVRQHNGHIYVYSEPDKGTTFKIYLPVVAGKAEETSVKDSRVMPLGNETVLVVDDDAAIRRLIKDTLEPLGYNIYEAGSGEDAIAVMARAKVQVDLILTDLIMPGMNGQELIEKVRGQRPEMKAILMSGYTDDIVARRGGIQPGDNFINKPLLPISLANKIREVLDGKPPDANHQE